MSGAGVKSGQRRASGETVADEVIKDIAAEADTPAEATIPEDKSKLFRTPGFSRMRTTWSSDTAPIIQRARVAVEERILANFADAYQVMHEVYELVREAEVNPETGEVHTDQWGFPIWKRAPSGSYMEDWTKLTVKQKESLLFAITTRIFDWEQRAADAWGEAMFAKAAWEERFSIGYDAPMSGTIEDRTAAGRLDSTEERYFAIFLSLYSRKADAVVRSLNLLGQRLKDSMTG